MARKGENIYHRKDNRWEGRYVKSRVDSVTRFGYVFGRTYRETKEKLAVARYEWQQRVNEVEHAKTTLLAISALWADDFKAALKPSTVAKYRDYLRCYILPEFGERDTGAITNGDVSSFCFRLLASGGSKGQGLSPKTVAEIFRVMKHLRKYAMNRGCRVGYTADCASIRQPQKTMRVFSPQEQERLHTYLTNHLDRKDNLGILVCLHTGIRVGELCALRWDDVSIDEKKLRIDKTMQRVRLEGETKTKIVIMPPKSSCAVRTIPLQDWLCEILAQFYKREAYVLTGSADKFIEPRTMQARFKSAIKACGIDDANFHALRHTFATRCVEEKFDAKCLSEILGHASVNMTMNRYVHPTMAMKRENMARLSAPEARNQ